MKNKTVLFNGFVICLLLLTAAGAPQPQAALASSIKASPPNSTTAMPAPIIEFPGIQRLDNPGPTNENLVPDTTGAAGVVHYLQAANEMIALYLKNGTLISLSSFNAFWSFASIQSPCHPQNSLHHGQNYVIFDHMARRWVVADIAYQDIDNGPYYVCIAVSNTLAAPTAPAPYFNNQYWYYYALSTDEGLTHYFPDSPKLGLWPDGYYLSADMFDVYNSGLNRTPRGVKVWALNRDDLMNGVGNYRYVPFYLNEQTDYEHLVPSNLLGDPPPTGTPNYFASIEPGKFYLWEFHVDWINPSHSTFGLNFQEPNTTLNTDTTAIWAFGYVVPQGAVNERVDVHGERLMTPLQYRVLSGVPSLWATHAILSGNVTGLRWMELRFDPSSSPYFYQQGTYQPDGAYRWMGSLATDRVGDMAVGFSISSSYMYPGIHYAGRLVNDALGQLPQGEAVLYNGTGSQQLPNNALYGPWGRQSHMTIDPVDQCIFWYTNMYYDQTGQNWRTRIGWFSFPGCKGGGTTRVSACMANQQGNAASGMDFEMYSVAISDIGRYVAFSSIATNMVADDHNGLRDVFLCDRDTDTDGIYDEAGAVNTIRVSRGVNSESNGNSWEVSISYNGRFVAFSSDANNLVVSDPNGTRDVFVFDSQNGTTEKVSVADITGNPGNARSDQPFISGNGSVVAFRSFASNLVPGDTNNKSDIFLRLRGTNRLFRFSVDTGGNQANGDSATPTLSETGYAVAFASDATNLAPGDANGVMDVFVHDFSGVTTLISTNGAGSGNADSYTPYISGDTRYVVFASRAGDLDPAFSEVPGSADIFLHDRTTVTNQLISNSFLGIKANQDSYSPSISYDGRFVAFASEADNLDVSLPDANARRDIFLVDRSLVLDWSYQFGLARRVSLSYLHGESNDWSFAPVVAPLGRYVAFVSEATNLVPNDTNHAWDVFAFDSQRTTPIFLSVPSNIPGSPGQVVSVPILFNRNGQSIDTTAFSIDFDQICLSFDPVDADHNGIPDNVIFSVPADFMRSASYNASDTSGEIDISIYDQTAPRAALPDGALATINFRVKSTCQAAPGSSASARVGFSKNPGPSFGAYGQSIPGDASDGFVRILPGKLGDCNGDGAVDAGDLSGLTLEIFDGDDVLPANTPGGTFPGNPVGCNPNQDYVVDAGDLSCTVMIIWGGGTAACTGQTILSSMSVEPLGDAMVSIDLPAEVPAKPASPVSIPVELQTKGMSVNSMVFSIDLDPAWLTFDPADRNADGLPDAITLSLPAGFQAFTSYDPADLDGELDVVIINPSSSGSALPDGTLMTLSFRTGSPTWTTLSLIASSLDPQASFGGVNGRSLPGVFNGGSIRISGLKTRIFLPLNLLHSPTH